MVGGDPLGQDLSNERTLASYRGDQLRLTDRRVIYRGRGLRRHESLSVHLEDVTAVGIGRRIGLNLYLLAVPLGILAFGLFVTLMTGWDDPVWMGLMWAFFTAPIIFVAPVHVIRVATAGARTAARIPRRHLADAKEFVQQVETVRAERKAGASRPEAATPTVRPFLA